MYNTGDLLCHPGLSPLFFNFHAFKFSIITNCLTLSGRRDLRRKRDRGKRRDDIF